MARVKRAKNARKNHKKVLKLAKGYYGGKSRLYKTANESVIRAMRNAYVGRKNKKRDYRSVWIARINAATRMNDLSYSKFMAKSSVIPNSAATERRIFAARITCELPTAGAVSSRWCLWTWSCGG